MKNNLKKRIKKGIAVLAASLMLTAINPAYAADYSIKIEQNGYLRSDGNYYFWDPLKAVAKNIRYINNDVYITTDGECYYYRGYYNYNGKKILDNVAMISDVVHDSYYDYFYYLDTDGNLMYAQKRQDDIETKVVIEKIGNLKQLDSSYALTGKGDLYYLGVDEARLIDTNVKSYEYFPTQINYNGEYTFYSMLYLKNDNSLYSSYGVDLSNKNEKPRHLLNNVTYYEVKGLQLRAKTSDNTWYAWGDNSSYQIYKDIVDGYNVAPKYVDVPRKITDNILYQEEGYELRLDGSFYRKDKESGTVKYTLLDTDVATVTKPGNGYIYQKFNGDVYHIKETWANHYYQPVPGTSKLLCKDVAIKVTDPDKYRVEYNLNIFKKDGTIVVIDRDGKVIDTLIPSKYFSSSSWAQAELQEADKLGLLDSVIDYVFDRDISRMKFCALIVDMCETYLGKEMPVSTSNPFRDLDYDDVKDQKDIILKAYAAGIVNGTDATTFSPSSTIDRQQMAAMMYRAAKYLNPGIKAGNPAKFADADKINNWAAESVNAMSSLGIIKGSDGKFNPNERATIEQSALMVLRLFKVLKQGA
ncbi:S-layer homology domain-containing protein [Pseudoclostridium thermosuccinogenes]|uniref:S-layer homology domain-containing protein n=1 Tax=Clostridium thermosuccinogenes TaxID=84032 RepID=UPI002FD9D4C8